MLNQELKKIIIITKKTKLCDLGTVKKEIKKRKKKTMLGIFIDYGMLSMLSVIL